MSVPGIGPIISTANLPLWKLFQPGEIIDEAEILPSPAACRANGRRDNAVDIGASAISPRPPPLSLTQRNGNRFFGRKARSVTIYFPESRQIQQKSNDRASSDHGI